MSGKNISIIIVIVVVVVVAAALAIVINLPKEEGGVSSFIPSRKSTGEPTGEPTTTGGEEALPVPSGAPSGTPAGTPTGEPTGEPTGGVTPSEGPGPSEGAGTGEPVSTPPPAPEPEPWKEPEQPVSSPPLENKDIPREAIKLGITAEGFSPQTITVRKGEEVTLSVSSQDQWTHVFKFKDASLAEVAVGVGPQETRAITFFAPSQAGEYEFYCDVPGHEGRGEKGKMIVR